MKVEFRSNKANVLAQLNANKKRCLTAWGVLQSSLAEIEIASMGAVDRGEMINSNTFVVSDDDVRVGNTAPHGIFLTMGTRFMTARPYLQNSVYNHKDRYVQVAKKTLGEGF